MNAEIPFVERWLSANGSEGGLTLSRRTFQGGWDDSRIVIGDNIVVTLVECYRARVANIGILAPPWMSIWCAEDYFERRDTGDNPKQRNAGRDDPRFMEEPGSTVAERLLQLPSVGLKLQRRRGQALAIGDECIVVMSYVRHEAARIHVAAPKSIAIHRAEVYGRVCDERREAAREAATAA